MDRLRHKCNKIVASKYATGNQPNQTEAHDASIQLQCAEVTGVRAWLSNDGWGAIEQAEAGGSVLGT